MRLFHVFHKWEFGFYPFLSLAFPGRVCSVCERYEVGIDGKWIQLKDLK